MSFCLIRFPPCWHSHWSFSSADMLSFCWASHSSIGTYFPFFFGLACTSGESSFISCADLPFLFVLSSINFSNVAGSFEASWSISQYESSFFQGSSSRGEDLGDTKAIRDVVTALLYVLGWGENEATREDRYVKHTKNLTTSRHIIKRTLLWTLFMGSYRGGEGPINGGFSMCFLCWGMGGSWILCLIIIECF